MVSIWQTVSFVWQYGEWVTIQKTLHPLATSDVSVLVVALGYLYRARPRQQLSKQQQQTLVGSLVSQVISRLGHDQTRWLESAEECDTNDGGETMSRKLANEFRSLYLSHCPHFGQHYWLALSLCLSQCATHAHCYEYYSALISPITARWGTLTHLDGAITDPRDAENEGHLHINTFLSPSMSELLNCTMTQGTSIYAPFIDHCHWLWRGILFSLVSWIADMFFLGGLDNKVGQQQNHKNISIVI